MGLLSILIGCVPIPPREIPISDVPAVTGPSARISVLRKKELLYGTLTQYISVDGVMIARLEGGEYTTFSVPEGVRFVTVTMNFGEIGMLPPFFVVFYEPRRASWIIVECEGSKEYFLASYAYWPPDIWSRVGKALQGDPHAEDRIQFKLEHIERPEGEFRLEHYRYVPPGPSKQK